MLKEQGNLSIDSENIFPIIKKWLYSDQDIFIREIISNGIDAIQKRKKLVMLGEAASDEDVTYRVDVTIDPDEKTITVSDNGIGMTDEEVKKYITQIAFSGASEFLEKYKDMGDDSIIGHFGLGFYSAFMVSEIVEIETLSCLPDAEPVHWSCDGSSSYEMTEGTRTEIGTDIILRINEDGEKYLTTWELRQIIDKYCGFMPVPIYLTNVKEEAEKAEKAAEKAEEAEKNKDDAEAAEPEAPEEPKPINDIHPLWLKNPSDCTDDEYKAFYHKVFNDYRDPLFWIHLNMDYPYNLKGILYFPKINYEFESAEGQVKLYCNQVFVADNVKEIIPEFLLLLKGAIDCPDIPLNVSRSFLQNDREVQKISDYITRKVADKLKSLYNTERENYEQYWADIHPFIKYGCIRNEKFYERVQDALIFRSAVTGSYMTLADYLEAAKESHENQVFYTTDSKQQAAYLKVLKDQDWDAVELGSSIDSPYIQMLESKHENVHFYRVDTDLDKLLKDQEAETSEDDQKKMEELFKKLLNKESLTVRLESFKDPSISAMIETSEQNRRMEEMMRMYGMSGQGYYNTEETLVLNQSNVLVERLLENPEGELSELLAPQIYDLARISHAPLEADDLNAFIARSNELLEQLL